MSSYYPAGTDMRYFDDGPEVEPDYEYEMDDVLQCLACNEECIEMKHPDVAYHYGDFTEWYAYGVKCPECGDVSDYDRT